MSFIDGRLNTRRFCFSCLSGPPQRAAKSCRAFRAGSSWVPAGRRRPCYIAVQALASRSRSTRVAHSPPRAWRGLVVQVWRRSSGRLTSSTSLPRRSAYIPIIVIIIITACSDQGPRLHFTTPCVNGWFGSAHLMNYNRGYGLPVGAGTSRRSLEVCRLRVFVSSTTTAVTQLSQRHCCGNRSKPM